MIHLAFEGDIKNRAKYEAFAEEVLDQLLPYEFPVREIVIGIRFVPIIGREYGLAHCEEENEYLIEIAKAVVWDGEIVPCTAQEIASTIAHELTHVKQYIRKEFNATGTRWKGQEVPFGPRGGCKIPYAQLPWEKEAFETEKIMVELLWEI